MRPEKSQVLALDAIDSALSEARLRLTPFPHFVLPDMFDSATAAAVLSWFENGAEWTLESREFYIQHGCSKVAEGVAQSPAAVVAAPETLQLIRRHVERIFGVALSATRFRIAAHRMLPGHRLRIHNDCPSHGTETHRLLINFNSGFDDAQGGHLVLLSVDDPSESAVILRPLHNCAVAMEFSERSWHCVDEIKTGRRYSLLYSFWTEDSTSEADESGTAGASANRGHYVDEDEFQELVSILREIGANAVPHSTRYLIDHLKGTYRILQTWQCDRDTCVAGLFHSVLGTPGFPRRLVSDDRVEPIREAIGERALLLVRLFSRTDRSSLLSILAGEHTLDGGASVRLSRNDARALVSMVWANILEQSAYAPHEGEEAARLKELYEQTAHLLPPRSHEQVSGMLATGGPSQP